MQCSYPMLFNGIKCPCGICMACRVNRKRLWTHRIMLESFCHEENLFVTLTYDPEHLPSDGCLQPRDMQLFMKRLRKVISPVRFRYYLAGEYGEKNRRPHYHMCLFGLGIQYESAIQKCWDKGFIHIGTLTDKSAGYVAGYVTKKLTSNEIGNLTPEFTRMSLKPGIGANALPLVSKALSAHDITGDVPTVLRHGKRLLPLGRYLRSKLRDLLGIEHDPEQVKKEAQDEMRALYIHTFGLASYFKVSEGTKDYQLEMTLRNEQQERNLIAKEKLKVRKL